MCLSTSCIHLVSYVGFPPLASPQFLAYAVSISEFLLRPCASQQLPACIWFQYLGFPCLSTTSSAHLVLIFFDNFIVLAVSYFRFMWRKRNTAPPAHFNSCRADDRPQKASGQIRLKKCIFFNIEVVPPYSSKQSATQPKDWFDEQATLHSLFHWVFRADANMSNGSILYTSKVFAWFFVLLTFSLLRFFAREKRDQFLSGVARF